MAFPQGKVQWPRIWSWNRYICLLTAEPMYRAVTSVENGPDGDAIDTEKLKHRQTFTFLSYRSGNRASEYLFKMMNVRTKLPQMEVSSKVSPISALDFVRSMVKTTTGNGTKRDCHGWPRYQYDSIRMPNWKYLLRLLRNPCSMTLWWIESRTGSQFWWNFRECETTWLHQSEPKSKSLKSRWRITVGQHGTDDSQQKEWLFDQYNQVTKA